MRHSLKLLLIALVLALVVAAMPAAVARSAPASTITAKYSINVRSGPGTGYTVIGVLAGGATAPVTGRNASTTWLYVEHRPGASGWVAAWLVTANGDIASLPVVGAGSGPTGPTVPSTPVTTGRTTTSVNMRPEPNPYNTPITVVPGGATIDVFGRNSAATWLYAGYQGKQGWVFAAYVQLASGTVSSLPIIGAQPQPPAQPTPAPPTQPAPPPTSFAPYIHNITGFARQIYQDGQARGNPPARFSKVGDSITATWAFLNKIGDGIYDLHEYSYLQPVINFYAGDYLRTGNSFNNNSLAAVEGWSSYDLLDPIHTDHMCPGLPPIECEYNYSHPSVSIIMIGTNDARFRVENEVYTANLHRMIDISIAYGVIPVLSTIPYNAEGDEDNYNRIIIATANARGIPWMDFYAATINLPNHGNDPDGVHPNVPPTNDPTNFTAQNLKYGHTVRNLLTLHMLDAIWRQAMQ